MHDNGLQPNPDGAANARVRREKICHGVFFAVHRPAAVGILVGSLLTIIVSLPLIAAPTKNDPAPSFVALARQRLGRRGIAQNEERLLNDVQKGLPTEFDAKSRETNVIDSSVFRWLCTDPETVRRISLSGIVVQNAHIHGPVTLDHVSLPFSLQFKDCAFDDLFVVKGATCESLSLSGSILKSINGERLDCAGSLDLFKVICTAGVALDDARIRRDLICDGARLSKPALTGEAASMGASVDSVGHEALKAENVSIGGSVYLRDSFISTGSVDFKGAHIGGLFSTRGATLTSSAEGEPRGNRTALDASGMDVGDVLLRDGCQMYGDVKLTNAVLHGDLSCRNAVFKSDGYYALDATGITVNDVLLRDGFRAEGDVSFRNATIRGDLSCRKGTFIGGADKEALDFSGAHIFGSARFTSFSIEGSLSLLLSKVDGLLVWADVSQAQTSALDLRECAAGAVQFKGPPLKGNLELVGLTYRAIAPDATAGARDKARLGGTDDATEYIDWVERQGRFAPQPFVQLADALKKNGDSSGATQVLIAMEDQRTSTASGLEKWLRWTFGAIGYGYAPERAWYGLAGFLVVGTVFFGLAKRNEMLMPTHSEAAGEIPPTLCPFLYSLDVLVPIINLYQRDYWLPNARSGRKLVGPITTGILLATYFRIHIIIGWALTTILVAAFLGLIHP